MKINESEKVVARIDTPKFKKHPIFSIAIGGDGNKWFGFTRGDNYGVLGILGVYFSFRLPYQPSIVFGQGVEAGFNAATKTVAYLVNKVNQQAIMIAQLTELLQQAANDEDEEDDDDNEFKPNWN